MLLRNYVELYQPNYSNNWVSLLRGKLAEGLAAKYFKKRTGKNGKKVKCCVQCHVKGMEHD
jgi:hypothetical protein